MTRRSKRTADAAYLRLRFGEWRGADIVFDARRAPPRARSQRVAARAESATSRRTEMNLRLHALSSATSCESPSTFPARDPAATTSSPFCLLPARRRVRVLRAPPRCAAAARSFSSFFRPNVLLRRLTRSFFFAPPLLLLLRARRPVLIPLRARASSLSPLRRASACLSFFRHSRSRSPSRTPSAPTPSTNALLPVPSSAQGFR